MNVCRLCLTAETQLIDIHGEQGQTWHIADIIARHFWSQISQSKDSKICQKCWTKTDDFHTFYCQIDANYPDKQNIVVDKFEILSDDYEVKTESDAVYIPILSPEAIKEESDSFQEDVTVEKSLQIKPAKKEIKGTSLIAHKGYMEDVQLPDYVSHQCDECSATFTTWFEAKKHYKQEHNSKGFIVCNCCGVKFSRKFLLLDHMETRRNPDAFKCHICSRTFDFRDNLSKHMHKHMTTKSFKCDQCEKSFTRQGLLNFHIKISHTLDKSFKCSVCDKCFSTKWSLTTHVRSIHEGAYTQICEICAKTFKSKTLYDLHKRNVHAETPPPKVQCDNCQAWLSQNSVRSHSKTCSNRPNKSEFACDVCDKSYPNSRAMKAHKKFVHGPKSVFPCTVCEKSFRETYRLKEHMTIHTGASGLYTCPFEGCTKTCNSKANMYKHKKQKHSAE